MNTKLSIYNFTIKNEHHKILLIFDRLRVAKIVNHDESGWFWERKYIRRQNKYVTQKLG